LQACVTASAIPTKEIRWNGRKEQAFRVCDTGSHPLARLTGRWDFIESGNSPTGLN
jgi:hypothetical protein